MGGHNTLAAGMTFFRQRIFLAGCLWWVTVTPWLFGGASPAGVTVYPLTLTDGAGRTVILPGAPRRIVSLSPAITDLVVAVGAGDELAGITRYCTAPAGHADIARVGGLDDPDYERILALQPDLVLVPSLKDPALLNKLEELGLRVVVMHAEGLDHLGPDFQLVGQATGREAAGDALARQWGVLRDLVHRRLRGAPQPSAIVIYGPGLLVPGPEGFAGQLLDEAGASNVVPAGSTAWQELAPEALLRLDPAVIFIVSDDTAPWPATPALRNLTAVRAGRSKARPCGCSRARCTRRCFRKGRPRPRSPAKPPRKPRARERLGPASLTAQTPRPRERRRRLPRTLHPVPNRARGGPHSRRAPRCRSCRAAARRTMSRNIP
jgi:iron complex transport system substrate-binding protein